MPNGLSWQRFQMPAPLRFRRDHRAKINQQLFEEVITKLAFYLEMVATARDKDEAAHENGEGQRFQRLSR